jgi:outer membrane protein TolC
MNGGLQDDGCMKRATLLAAAVCGCLSFAGHADDALDQDLAPPAQAGMAWQPARPLEVAPSVAKLDVSTPLTLAALTDFALRNNPATRESWAAARAQAAAVGIADAAYYPTLDLGSTLTRGKTTVNSSTGVTSSNAQTRLSANVSLGYVLFDFGARSAAKRAAQYGLLAADLSQNRALQDVALRVEQAYYQLLGARQTVVAGEEVLKGVQLSVDVANARRQAGLATVGDVYQAETLLAQSRLQLRKAQGDVSKFKGALCSAAGLPVNAKLELAPLEDRLPTQAVRATVDDYLARASTERPDLGAAEAEARAAHASAAAASAQGDPSLSLSINGGKTFNNFQDARFSNGSSSGTIGLTLNVPLFDGFRTTSTVRQAQARAEQLDATRDRIARQVELEVWQAYFDLDTAQAAIDSAHALLRSASLAREVAQERYRAGIGNMPDLLTAQVNEANAHMEVIQAEMGWYASLSLLNNAIGAFSSGTESE